MRAARAENLNRLKRTGLSAIIGEKTDGLPPAAPARRRGFDPGYGSSDEREAGI